jgi:ribonuclease HII
MKYIVGIDEVGRGSLAGPVTACAALVPASVRFRWHGAPSLLKESKQLSAEKREAWVRYLRTKPYRMCWAFASVSNCVIDRRGIEVAANTAARRAYRALCHKNPFARRAPVILDQGLSIGVVGKRVLVRSFPKADEQMPAVAVASLLAKVHRDQRLAVFHRRYPLYGFASHKGYGTLAHRRALMRHGPSAAHRLTFLGSSIRMKRS